MTFWESYALALAQSVGWVVTSLDAPSCEFDYVRQVTMRLERVLSPTSVAVRFVKFPFDELDWLARGEIGCRMFATLMRDALPACDLKPPPAFGRRMRPWPA